MLARLLKSIIEYTIVNYLKKVKQQNPSVSTKNFIFYTLLRKLTSQINYIYWSLSLVDVN